MPILNKDKYPKNYKCLCVDLCPVGAITQKDIDSPPVVDNKKCIHCGACIKGCPYGALTSKPTQ